MATTADPYCPPLAVNGDENMLQPIDFNGEFDADNPAWSLLFELDPNSPPWIVAPSNFGSTAAAASEMECVDPSQLKCSTTLPGTGFPPTLFAAAASTNPTVTTDLPQTFQQQPVLALPSLPPQQPQRHPSARRSKKVTGGFPCTHLGCGRCFDRACDLRKHDARKHTPQEQRARQCPQPGCGKRFIWPKDVTRHQRQVHGGDGNNDSDGGKLTPLAPVSLLSRKSTTYGRDVEIDDSDSYFDDYLLASPTTDKISALVNANAATTNNTNADHGPAAKRQRQFLSALPRKFGTTLLLCRSVVLLKALRLRRNTQTAAEPEPMTTTTTATTTPTTTKDTRGTATLPAAVQPALLSLPPPPPARRCVLVTRNRTTFEAVDISDAADAAEVLARAAAAVGVPAAPGAAPRTDGVFVSEYSLLAGAGRELRGDALMRAVAERGGEAGGLMLALTVVKEEDEST